MVDIVTTLATLTDTQVRAVLELIGQSWYVAGWLEAGNQRDKEVGRKFAEVAERAAVDLHLALEASADEVMERR